MGPEVDLELDPASTSVEGVAREAEDVEGIHDRDRFGDLLSRCGVETR